MARKKTTDRNPNLRALKEELPTYTQSYFLKHFHSKTDPMSKYGNEKMRSHPLIQTLLPSNRLFGKILVKYPQKQKISPTKSGAEIYVKVLCGELNSEDLLRLSPKYKVKVHQTPTNNQE